LCPEEKNSEEGLGGGREKKKEVKELKKKRQRGARWIIRLNFSS